MGEIPIALPLKGVLNVVARFEKNELRGPQNVHVKKTVGCGDPGGGGVIHSYMKEYAIGWTLAITMVGTAETGA